VVSLETLIQQHGLADAIQAGINKGLGPAKARYAAQRIQTERLLGEVLVSLGHIKPLELNYILDRYQKRKRIGDMLIEAGYISPGRFSELLKQRGRSSVPIGEYLVLSGAVKDAELLDVLSRQFNIPIVSRNALILGQAEKNRLQSIISSVYAKRHRILPIQIEGSDLTIALRDPRIVKDLSLAMLGQFNVTYALMLDSEYRLLFREIYNEELDPKKESMPGAIQATEHLELNLDERPDDGFAGDAAAVMHDIEAHELVNRILAVGMDMGASDIHIEQDFGGLKLRYRVDGVLINAPEDWMIRKLREKVGAVVSRIKIMSDLDIAERRLPQDGAFRMSYREKTSGQKATLDFRVATCKATVGENVVIRILDSRKAGRSLKELNFEPSLLTAFEKALRNPAGMILVTGPTGSGKSTTLYAALQHVSHPGIKVITAEDPVEYNFPGIMQTQIHPKIGLTFPRLLRSFLRLDPDVILVGEIRDRDTAQIAFDAAQTGHLLLSTLHTNDSFGTLVRLRDLEVDYGQMAESLKAVLAQRLVRKVCPKCSEEYEPEESEWAPIFVRFPEKMRFVRGVGCEECHYTGYKGRMMVSELFMVEDKAQGLIARRSDLDSIRRAAYEQGMKTMVEDAVSKLNLTTLQEIIRTVPGDLIDQYRMRQQEMGLEAVLPSLPAKEPGTLRAFGR